MKNIQIRTASQLALVLTAGIGLAACGDRSVSVPTVTVPANPQAFFAANGAPVQNKTITLGGSATVSASFAQGTRLTFVPGSVLNADGTAYVGDVVLSVREITSKADMLLSNVLTNSNEKPIVSGGMFNLDLKTPAGAALDINPAKGVGAAVPLRAAPVPGVVDNKGMQQFVGSQKTCGSKEPSGAQLPGGTPIAAGDSSVNWCPVAGQFSIDTTTAPGAYVFSVFNKGWINCDFFYSDPRPKTTIHIGFTPVNDANTIMFLVPQGINTVIALYTQDGANARKSYQNSLPIGMTTELVAITFDAGKQYLAHKTVTVSADLTDSLNFAEASAADIKTYLAALN